MATVLMVSEWRDRQQSIGAEPSGGSNGSGLVGDEVETPQGIISIYKIDRLLDDEMVQDVRLVAMKTGSIVRVADDPKAWIYGEQAIGYLGYVAQVKVGERGGDPVADMVFINFPELQRFVIAREIYALDAIQELDDRAFSAVLWDGPRNARFIVVDTKTGTIKLTRELDFRQSGRTSLGSPESLSAAPAKKAAPRNVFH